MIFANLISNAFNQLGIVVTVQSIKVRQQTLFCNLRRRHRRRRQCNEFLLTFLHDGSTLQNVLVQNKAKT